MAACAAVLLGAMSLPGCTGVPAAYPRRSAAYSYQGQPRYAPAAPKVKPPLSADEKQALFERFSTWQDQRPASD